MAKKIPFECFLECIDAEHKDFVKEVHQKVLEERCTFEIKEAKAGFVLSYRHPSNKSVFANYVFRKKGPMMRIYADHVNTYMNTLELWPQAMKDTVAKATSCRRLLNPEACNEKCQMGFDFILDGQRQQKCRNNAFMFFVTEETKPYMQTMLQQELECRK